MISTEDAAIPDSISMRLLDKERVVWWGQPGQGLILTPRDGFLIPFSLFWGGFALFWETKALQSNAPFPFALFGVPFLIIGLFLIFGRFLVDRWLRGRILYALTDSRVLIARSGPWPSFQALSLDRLPEATLAEGSNGRGTIRFGPQAWGSSFANGRAGFNAWVPALDPTPQFIDIDDVQRVFRAVQERSRKGSM